jgi:hypothetical protein
MYILYDTTAMWVCGLPNGMYAMQYLPQNMKHNPSVTVVMNEARKR